MQRYPWRMHLGFIMARRNHVSILLLCTLGAILDVARAQSVNLPLAPQDNPNSSSSIRVNSNLVLIPVSVVDRNEKSVVGLDQNSFRLYDDKVEQIITHFSMEDGPISVAFLFDASSSMADKIREAREAVSAFLKTANPTDEFLLIQFSDEVNLLLGFTKEADEVQRHLALIQPRGRTALLDAIDLSIHQLRHAHNIRKAVVIVSDGGDNCSRRTISEIKSLVRESDVLIYALGIFDSWDLRSQTHEEEAGPGLLRDVAKQSGGALFEIKDLSELPDIAAKMGNALRTQYVLGYTPAKPRMDGKYHKVNVKVVHKGSSKLRASWRRGYYAPVD
jgi:Ca-activated chloride channel homolog